MGVILAPTLDEPMSVAAEPAKHAETRDASPANDSTGLPATAEADLGDPNAEAGTEVFVGGLPSDATEEAVTAAFAKVGPVQSVRYQATFKSRKYFCQQPYRVDLFSAPGGQYSFASVLRQADTAQAGWRLQGVRFRPIRRSGHS